MKNCFNTVSAILLLSLLVVSCRPKWEWGTDPGKQTRYFLLFEFLDSEGNPLGKDLELVNWTPSNVSRENATSGTVSKEAFKCDIILSRPSEHFNNETYETTYANGQKRGQDMNFYWRYNKSSCQTGYDFWLHRDLVEPQDVLTYEIVSRDIFGDGEKHVITTYWRNHEKVIGRTENRFPECYRVEYNGKDYDVRSDSIEHIVTIRL